MRQKISAKYYFQVNPGGYGDSIPDKEYVEFPDEEAVLTYVRDTVLNEVQGTMPQDRARSQQSLTFPKARKILLQIGEFGPMGRPLVPPNPDTITGALTLPEEDEELEEVPGAWWDDPLFQKVLYRVFQALTPEGRVALLSEAVPVALQHLRRLYDEWTAQPEKVGLEEFVRTKESSFFKLLPQVNPEEEDWLRELGS